MELDEDLAVFLGELAAVEAPPITAGSVAQAREGNRAFLASMEVEAPAVAAIEDCVIPGTSSAIRARRYWPGSAPASSIAFFHGGGWVIGGLEGHDRFCRALAVAANADVLSVDYRLAPEHRYPAGLDDCTQAARWLAARCEGRPLVVCGDSSGGNLAAAVALRAVDEPTFTVDLQVLLYPVLDHDLTTASYERLASGHLLTREDMRWFWDHYVPDVAARSDPYVSPLRRADLRGVAEALLVVAGHDPLRDEGVAYAGRLEAAGVPVRLVEYGAMIHGFLTLNKITPVATEAVEAIGQLVQNAVARPASLIRTEE